jgi:hypothetical protein
VSWTFSDVTSGELLCDSEPAENAEKAEREDEGLFHGNAKSNPNPL